MEFYERIAAKDIDSARDQILDYIRRNREKKIIYFNGLSGLGAAPVLRSIAQELRSIKAKKTPPELCFDRIIYIDCSVWESRRKMQRKIAEELELDLETMAMFDKQDEEDDFNGVHHGSRDVIQRVSEAIAQILWNKKLMMIFLNGSNDEVDVNSGFGIIPNYCNHVTVWAFKRQVMTIHDKLDVITTKLRYTHLYVYNGWATNQLTSSEFRGLLREEAANIVARHPCMWGINLTMVMECVLYELFLQYSFHRSTGFDWVAHAPNYWMCDGIIEGGGTRETIEILHQEIHWECDPSPLGIVFEKLMEDGEAPFLVVKDDLSFKRRPYRWISLTSKNLMTQEDMQAISERASSLFVAPHKSDKPQGLPNGFLKHCRNLGVVLLSHCAFSFVSPPFLECHRLRFLGLDHCTHDSTSGENSTNWKCLQNLWVLDLRYTEWDGILSEEKMDIMANLRELNIEGFMCWQLTTRLHGRLPYLQKLRIIKPTHKPETPVLNSSNSFVDKTELEILDLSGNTDMENLPTSLSMARSLKMLILDGCDGIESVVVPNGHFSSLQSFSFDGYGPAKRRMPSFKLSPESYEPERPSDANRRVVRTSKISLQGCMQLENLFVRGLSNLVELDLSGCPIKVLDLTAMVVNVPGLKRLFLLGCEHLVAILWGPFSTNRQLELLCIDTRPGKGKSHRFILPSLAQHKSFHLQLHAIVADVRLTRSLYNLVIRQYATSKDIYLNIRFTSSTDEYQIEASGTEMIDEHNNHQHHVLARQYGKVFSKIGDAPLLVFPQPPDQELDRHVEISDGNHGLESELERSFSLAYLVKFCAESLHVHDASTSASMPGDWLRLKWCRIERCPNLDAVFAPAEAWGDKNIQTMWASDLQTARCIWSKGSGSSSSFESLQYLHLRSCPRLEFVLPVWVSSFPSLESLHIVHCGDLRHVFVLNGGVHPEKIVANGVPFPKLTTIQLHDLPKLRQICEVKMLAPALETVRIRGCFGLQARREEADRGDGEGRVGRAGVGRAGRRPPPGPLRASRALSLLQAELPSQGHRAQVKS